MKLSKLNTDWGLWPIPTGSFSSLSKRVDELFNSFFGEPLSVFKVSGFPYNVREKKENDKVTAHVVEVALAGVNKDRINVSVTQDAYGNVLRVKVDKAEDKKDAVYQKISNSSYRLDLALQDTHDVENIVSEFKDGLLTVTVPVVQVTPPEPVVKQIEIK